ncbi:MAG TPA: hypothetical protein VMT27_02880, partial [Actinomycetes bacterium]|nr:hypothetical protein [Actinomycetes bacterium]
MARPTVLHQGFFVPNAQDVTKPELAEPDRIDFNISGNARWGILSGCLVTVSGATASNTAGTALVNGVLVDVVAGQNAFIGSGGTQNRFDLIGVDNTGKLVTVAGSPSLDPVFPDPPLTVTVLAAVLAVAGGGDYSDNVIDKRYMLADSLKTKLSPTADLVVNRNGSGNLFGINGAGKTSWAADVSIERIDFGPTGALRVTPNLSVDDAIAAGGNITAAKAITATLKVSGSNLRNTSALPSDASGAAGDLFTSTATGKAYIHQNGHWEEIATLKSSVPAGTVITSLQAPSYMNPLGWISLDGSIVTEVEAGTLFTIPALTMYITTPPSGPRTMQLPDSRRRVMLHSPDDIGRVGGSNSFSLLVANMPPHKHNSLVQAGGGANPQVRISRNGIHRHNVYGGAHSHPVTDPGHSHNGTDHPQGNQFVSLAWGGRNKID